MRPARGGIRQHVLELIRRLDPSRFDLSLAAPPDFLAGLPSDLPVSRKLSLDIAGHLSPRRDLLAATRLASFCKEADSIHAHGLRAAFVAALAARLRSRPLVVTAHNLLPASRFTRTGMTWIGSHVTVFIAVSEAVADGLHACGIPSAKIVIIPNGVDLEHFSVASPHSKERFTVGCLARLSPEKGVDSLLSAAALLPDIQFLVGGDGPESSKLKKLAPSNVTFLGQIHDTRSFYSLVDIVAVPSRQEGQGLVALEAMASGLPVVASRVGGLREMLTDGKTALLLPPDAPAALADAIMHLQQDASLRSALSLQGRQLVCECYDIRQMIRNIEKVYTDTLS